MTARFLNVLSVFAVFSLLHFQLDFPGRGERLEPVLEPDEVLAEAPV